MAWEKKLLLKQSLSWAGTTTAVLPGAILVNIIIGWIAMKCCTNTQGAKRMNTNEFGDPMAFLVAPPAGQLSLNQWDISVSTGWIATECLTDIHGPQRTNPHDFSDPLTFPIGPPWGWQFWSKVKCRQLLNVCTKLHGNPSMSPSGWTVIFWESKNGKLRL